MMPRVFQGKHKDRLYLPLRRLKKIKISSFSWWNTLRQRSQQIRHRENNRSSAHDWRSLSPHAPPLPIIDTAGAALTEPAPRIRKNQNRSPAFTPPMPYQLSTELMDNRKLYTILEESDLFVTSVPSLRSNHSKASVFGHTLDENKLKNEKKDDDQNDSHSVTSLSCPSDMSFHPPATSWQESGPTEDQLGPSLETVDEDQCKHSFLKMLRSAYQYRLDHKNDTSTKLSVTFDEKNNVRRLEIVLHDRTESREFFGNAQYIPPEHAFQFTNESELTEVWVLGISLYRMLLDKYPFEAQNDRQMFNLMLKGAFTIPPTLSEDAKDLLKRMLAPRETRASLDLVQFHPWLKPCSATFTPDIPTPNTASRQQSSSLETQHQNQGKQRDYNRRPVLRKLTGITLFLLKGPYPPPKRPYRDLAGLGKMTFTVS